MSPPGSGRDAPGETRLGEVDRFLVPARDRAVVAYFLDRLFVAHGLRERLLRRLLLSLGGRGAGPLLFVGSWSLESGTFALRPEEGTASAVAGGGEWRGSARLLRAIVEGAGSAGADPALEAVPVERSILVRDYGGSDRRQLVVFPFPPSSGVPAAVVKVRNAGERGELLRREREALRRVRARLPSPLEASVPRPIAYRRAGEVELLVLSHLGGRSAYVEMQNRLLPGRRIGRHFRAAADWLSAFHLATRRPEETFAPGPEDRARAARSAAAAGVPAWYEELIRLADRHPVPLAAGHGDFWARNLLLPAEPGPTPDGPPARVVDWEHATREAPPFVDLFHFAVSYGANYPWKGYRRAPVVEAFRRTFLADTPVSREARRYFRTYAERTGLPAALLEPLLHLYLLRRARDADPEARPQWRECERLLTEASGSVLGGGAR